MIFEKKSGKKTSCFPVVNSFNQGKLFIYPAISHPLLKSFLTPQLLSTHIMFYKERFIRNDFLTSQIFERFKEQTSQFLKK